MKNKKYYIYDWDGVFADSFNACNRAKVSMGQVDSIEEAEETTINYSNRKNLHTRNGKQKDIDEANKWTAHFAESLLKEEISLFKEFIQEVEKLKDVKLAIVSSGPGVVIRKLLRNINLDFTHVLSYEDHHSKEEKVEHICSDWGISIEEVYYFTDTKTDIWELSEIMDTSKIIGCSWGYSGYEKLKELLPENQILNEFSDIHNILKKRAESIAFRSFL